MSVNKTIVGSNHGLSPVRHQDIIWNNARILLIVPFEANLMEIGLEIAQSTLKKMIMNRKRQDYAYDKRQSESSKQE